MMRVVLVVGDWSQDGHNMMSEIHYDSNMDVEAIEEAYQAALKMGAPDVTEECEDFEVFQFTKSFVEKLRAYAKTISSETIRNGLAEILEYFTLHDEDDEYEGVDPDTFADIYAYMAMSGNPDLMLAKKEDMCHDKINIGGYGLFHP